jgi:hypothetical protein
MARQWGSIRRTFDASYCNDLDLRFLSTAPFPKFDLVFIALSVPPDVQRR